ESNFTDSTIGEIQHKCQSVIVTREVAPLELSVKERGCRVSNTPLTRSEAKDLTRRRLLRAALEILDKEGEAGLTTVAVAKAAGIAQSSFYVHFKDMQDLLRALADEGGERLR